jgi:hypothetical protein
LAEFLFFLALSFLPFFFFFASLAPPPARAGAGVPPG